MAQQFSDTIYAFDIMNEPHWCVAKVTGNLVGAPVDRTAVCGFLNACVAEVKRLLPNKSTIGHRYYDDLTGDFASVAVDLPQFHYYAHWYLLSGVPDLTGVASPKPFLGEFGSVTEAEASGHELLKIQKGTWDLGADEANSDNILPVRLTYLEKLGYELAITWPDLFLPKPLDTTEVLKLSPAKVASIKKWLTPP